MSNNERHSTGFPAGVILFFGTGAAIALPIAVAHIDSGGSLGGAIRIGSFFGGYGAWLSFLVAFRMLSCFRRVFRSNRK